MNLLSILLKAVFLGTGGFFQNRIKFSGQQERLFQTYFISYCSSRENGTWRRYL